jgi:excisionase family DNA binding protein
MDGVRFVTLGELSKMLNLSVRHLQREIDRGDLVACKFGRAVRVAWKDVESYIQRHRQECVG